MLETENLKLRDAIALLAKQNPSAPEYRVEVVTANTPAPFSTLLAAYLGACLPDRRVKTSSGVFGDLIGNLRRYLETEQGAPAVLLIEWADLDPRLGLRQSGVWGRKVVSDIVQTVETRIAHIAALLDEHPAGGPIALVPPTLPAAPVLPVPSWQTNALEASLAGVWSQFLIRISARERLRAVSPSSLAPFSAADRIDVKAWLQAGFPYRVAYASALAKAVARVLFPPPPLKGIITDLDNTLWHGILGEIGVANIAWDLDHHAASHGAYQRFLQSLAEDGVLIGIASKNDPALVQEALRRTDLFIQPGALFPVEAHWHPKAESAARILDAWNIGAASVLFLDDTPMEVEAMKMAFPDMLCRVFPANDPDALWQLLIELADLFGKPFSREEDAIRVESLRASAGQSALVSSGYSQEQVLAASEGKLAIVPVASPPDPRALELINKTNQFNLNGNRYLESDWRQFLQAAGSRVWIASYQDKFGPLGKISVVAGRQSGNQIALDAWVLSCRAFSRQIEYGILDFLFHQEAFEAVVLHFKPTERNGPLREFLESLGAPVAAEGPITVTRDDFHAKRPPLFLTMTSL